MKKDSRAAKLKTTPIISTSTASDPNMGMMHTNTAVKISEVVSPV